MKFLSNLISLKSVFCNFQMIKLRQVSSLEILLNIYHLEFFKNSYYKWFNKRLLGLIHMYLFTFGALSFTLIFHHLLYPIHADCYSYNILVYSVTKTDSMLSLQSLL